MPIMHAMPSAQGRQPLLEHTQTFLAMQNTFIRRWRREELGQRYAEAAGRNGKHHLTYFLNVSDYLLNLNPLGALRKFNVSPSSELNSCSCCQKMIFYGILAKN